MPERVAAQPARPALDHLHPASSLSHESPFAQLPAFGDSSEDDEPAAAPALDAIPECRSSRELSSAAGGGGGSAALSSRTATAVSGLLRGCNLSSAEHSAEDPLQGVFLLRPEALERAQTLAQHLEETAAARGIPYGPAAAFARLAKRRSSGRSSRAAAEAAAAAVAAVDGGDRPAQAPLAANSPPSLTEAAWGSLAGSEL